MNKIKCIYFSLILSIIIILFSSGYDICRTRKSYSSGNESEHSEYTDICTATDAEIATDTDVSISYNNSIDIDSDLTGDAAAGTLKVYPASTHDGYSYIQEVLSGSGSYFNSRNKFLFCDDSYCHSSPCYCIEPKKPTPNSNTSYSDLGFYDIFSEEGQRELKSFAILTYSYSGLNASCNSYLYNLAECNEYGGTYGVYVIDGTARQGLLIDGCFYEMTPTEAYALCALSIHKANGADIDSVSGTNISGNDQSVIDAFNHYQALCDYAITNGFASSSIFAGMSSLDSLAVKNQTFSIYIMDKTGAFVPLPENYNSTDFNYSDYSADGKITYKISYSSSHMENRLIESVKDGQEGRMHFSHSKALTVSFDPQKNGYYDYFHVVEKPENSISLDVEYGELYSNTNLSSTATGQRYVTSFCQDAIISISYDELLIGKNLDICLQTGVSSSKTPAYYDSDGDGESAYAARFFDCYGYQNVALASPNAIIPETSCDLRARNTSGKIKLTKASLEGIKLNSLYSLEGAKYTVYTSEDDAKHNKNAICTLITDSSHCAQSPLLPYGNYYIKETASPRGFKIDSDIHCLVLDSPMKELNVWDSPILQSFRIEKYGESCHAEGEILQGAGFMACNTEDLETDENGNYIWDENCAVVLTEDGDTEIFSDEDGNATSIPLQLGTYLIKETTCPEGYLPCDDFIIEINDSDATFPLVRKITDKAIKGRVSIIKYGEFSEYDPEGNNMIITEAPMENVHFNIIANSDIGVLYQKGDVIDELVTDQNGYALSNDIPVGNYILREDTPSGYYPIDDIEFEISTEDSVSEITINQSNVPVYLKEFEITNKKIVPYMKSLASDKSSCDKVSTASEMSTIIDTVHCYNLIEGEEYTIKGILVNGENGVPVRYNNSTVEYELSFVPNETEAELNLPYNFDSTEYVDKDIVVFEVLYLDDKIVAVDNSLENASQTVTYHSPKEEVSPSVPKTGDSKNPGLILLILVISVTVSMFFYKKSKKIKTK